MSTTSTETEITLYVRIDDLTELDSADFIEDHVQIEQTMLSGARIRVRKITPVKGGPETASVRYELTIKTKRGMDGGVPSSEETTQEVDRGFYEAFADVAERAMVKRRYTFIGRAPVVSGAPENLVLPAVKYEVDVFTSHSTRKRVNWAKVDIEIDQILEELRKNNLDTKGIRQRFMIKNLSFKAEDMFAVSNMNDRQKAILDDMWDNHYAIKLAPSQYKKDSVSAKPAADENKTNKPDASAVDESDGGVAKL